MDGLFSVIRRLKDFLKEPFSGLVTVAKFSLLHEKGSLVFLAFESLVCFNYKDGNYFFQSFLNSKFLKLTCAFRTLNRNRRQLFLFFVCFFFTLLGKKSECRVVCVSSEGK